MNEMDLKKDL